MYNPKNEMYMYKSEKQKVHRFDARACEESQK